MADGIVERAPSREQLIRALYDAAELEQNLMCNYRAGVMFPIGNSSAASLQASFR